MRDAFLLDPDLIFLNHGSYGACPREVFARYQAWQLEMERNPVEFLGRRSAALLAQARGELGQYLGARGEDLVFLPNATTGVNTVAASLDLQPGDEVLSPDHEYGACDATWQQVCQRAGAHYRRVEVPLPFDRNCWTQRLMSAAGPRTRMIFASHISSTTALIFPVAELCEQARRRGILTLIDGAHAPGQLALDLHATSADYYTGNCHKWMCAPKGAAFLHARPEHQAQLQATVVSWGYVAGSSEHSFYDAYTGRSPIERRLQWQGTRDLAAFLSVPEAIAFQARNDWPSHQAHCHDRAIAALHQASARNGLAPIARDEDHAQMVPIPVRTNDADALRRHLFDQHRIEVPVTRHGAQSFVRVSVQAYNSAEDLNALQRALSAAGV